MPLPSGVDLLAYMRQPLDQELVSANALIARALALVELELTVPIVQHKRTWDLRPEDHPTYGCAAVLFTPSLPWKSSSVVVADDEGTDLTNDVQADGLRGLLRPDGDLLTFARPWYRVEVELGWSTHPQYTRYEPALIAAILDTAADYYQRRHPSLGSASSGGGVSESYSDMVIPPRVQRVLAPFLPRRVR